MVCIYFLEFKKTNSTHTNSIHKEFNTSSPPFFFPIWIINTERVLNVQFKIMSYITINLHAPLQKPSINPNAHQNFYLRSPTLVTGIFLFSFERVRVTERKGGRVHSCVVFSIRRSVLLLELVLELVRPSE